MILNPATPDFVRGQIGVGGKIFERLVTQAGRIQGGHAAKHTRRKVGVIRQVPRALPGLGGEGRALGKLRLE